MTKKRIIFCDFDGTITVNDNIVAIMKHFKPEGWDTLVDQVISKQISIREGVGRMFALSPTSMKQEVIDYAIGNVTIRAGFQEPPTIAGRKRSPSWLRAAALTFSCTRYYPSLPSLKKTSIATALTLEETASALRGRTHATRIAVMTAVCARRRLSAPIPQRNIIAF